MTWVSLGEHKGEGPWISMDALCPKRPRRLFILRTVDRTFEMADVEPNRGNNPMKMKLTLACLGYRHSRGEHLVA